MGTYRKKPVVVQAVRWTGQGHREMWNFLTGKTDEYMETSGEHFYIDHTQVEGGLIIKTHEGDMVANIGDYVIKEPLPTGDRLFYPCKPDFFKKTYEEVEVTEGPTDWIGKALSIYTDLHQIMDKFTPEEMKEFEDGVETINLLQSCIG